MSQHFAQILGIKMYASVAGYPESTDDVTGNYAEILCHQAAYLSREHCFKESEAFFVATLGMRESKLRNWENARRLIERSLNLYRTLAKIEPVLGTFPTCQNYKGQKTKPMRFSDYFLPWATSSLLLGAWLLGKKH